jgi:maleylpyruvate isomerase
LTAADAQRPPQPVRLYGYFRSGAAWRVRIGLAWKAIAVEQVSIDLRSGAQAAPDWRARNPQAMVPALELSDGTLLTQSLAILEWLDERFPAQPFLPASPELRAAIRSVVLVIAADTHPIQNLGILKRVEALAGAEASMAWGKATVETGLAAVEALVARNAGPFAFGNAPTLADIAIVPQLLNARRFGVDLEPFPRVRAIEAACLPLPAFAAAHPQAQPDAG